MSQPVPVYDGLRLTTVTVVAAVTLLTSQQGIGCIITNLNGEIQVWIGRVISIKCVCTATTANATKNAFWTLNGRQYPSSSPHTVISFSDSTAGTRLVETEITTTIDDSNLGRVCCEMKKSLPACVIFKLTSDAGRNTNTSIFFQYTYSGNRTWNVTVKCTMVTDREKYRDNAAFSLTVDGNTKNSYFGPNYKVIDFDETSLRDGVTLWTRETWFQSVAITGQSAVTLECLLKRSGLEKYGQIATALFEPRLPTPAMTTTPTFPTTTTTITTTTTTTTTTVISTPAFSTTLVISTTPVISTPPLISTTPVVSTTSSPAYLTKPTVSPTVRPNSAESNLLIVPLSAAIGVLSVLVSVCGIVFVLVKIRRKLRNRRYSTRWNAAEKTAEQVRQENSEEVSNQSVGKGKTRESIEADDLQTVPSTLKTNETLNIEIPQSKAKIEDDEAEENPDVNNPLEQAPAPTKFPSEQQPTELHLALTKPRNELILTQSQQDLRSAAIASNTTMHSDLNSPESDQDSYQLKSQPPLFGESHFQQIMKKMNEVHESVNDGFQERRRSVDDGTAITRDTNITLV